MERYNGILIYTTNRMTGLDNASIRGFNHKFQFDYLTPEGNVILPEANITPEDMIKALYEESRIKDAHRGHNKIGFLN